MFNMYEACSYGVAGKAEPLNLILQVSPMFWTGPVGMHTTATGRSHSCAWLFVHHVNSAQLTALLQRYFQLHPAALSLDLARVAEPLHQRLWAVWVGSGPRSSTRSIRRRILWQGHGSNRNPVVHELTWFFATPGVEGLFTLQHQQKRSRRCIVHHSSHVCNWHIGCWRHP